MIATCGDALQWPEIVLRHRRAAADQQHRDALELRIRDGGHAVRDTGTRGGHATPSLPVITAWQCAMCTAGAFVAHVEDTHAALREMVPDRLDVSALQAVYAVDTARDEEFDDPFGDASDRGFGHWSSPSWNKWADRGR